MVKGRYVATVVVDISYDEKRRGIDHFEKVKERITGGDLDRWIVALLSYQLGENCSVGLNRQYADLYCEDGGINDDK